MDRRTAPNPLVRLLAALLLLAGLLVTLGAVFADQLGLIGRGEGLGWKQLIGVIVGLMLLLGGGAWLLQPPGRRDA